MSSQAETKHWYASVRQAMLDRALEFLNRVVPGGRVVGHEYCAASIQGGHGDSFKCNLNSGLWRDFATNEPSGKDLISLYARVRGIKYAEAAKRCAAEFGIEKTHTQQPRLRPVPDWQPITPIPDSAAPHGDDEQPILPPHSKLKAGGKVADVWCYCNAESRALMWRVRIDTADGKLILPLTFCMNEKGERAWRWRDLPTPRPLYGLEYLAALADAPVLIVSGEKTAEAARRLLPDWIVITWPGGDQNVKHTDWGPLNNRNTRIVIWPDADASGKKAAAEIVEIVGACELVQPDALWSKGWDLADAESEGWTEDRVLACIAGALEVQPSTATNRPSVSMTHPDLELKAQAVWHAVRSLNDPPWLMDSASGLVLVRRNESGRAVHEPITVDLLRWVLISRFVFLYETNAGVLPATPPDVLLKYMIATRNPPLPLLRRLVEAPIFAPDGRLILREGFDVESGIYYLPSPELANLSVPEQPTDADVAAASAYLRDEIFRDFPFETQTDRANCYAALFTSVARETIDGPTPWFITEAPVQDTGKTLLARTIAIAVAGSDFAASRLPREEEEVAKLIISLLREGSPVVLFENLSGVIDSPALAAALTFPAFKGRVLGVSQTTGSLPIKCTWLGSGNNCEFKEDIPRRVVGSRLNAYLLKPSERKFRHDDLPGYLRKHRAEYLQAVLTVAQAWAVRGPPARQSHSRHGFI
jgi:putative DNA primase/helicase